MEYEGDSVASAIYRISGPNHAIEYLGVRTCELIMRSTNRIAEYLFARNAGSPMSGPGRRGESGYGAFAAAESGLRDSYAGRGIV